MKKSIIALLILLGICALLYATTDQTVVLTKGWVERRNQEPLIKPVWEYVITATYSDTDDGNITHALPVNGILLKVILKVPSDSAEVEILDNGDNKIFDSADQAEGTYTFNVYEPITGTMKVVMGPDAAMGAGEGGNIIVYLRGI